ncbi:folate family ECF transporter S component [Wansuia hejianensis]|uniref:Folate family ECF transporter S component n=1 Tax=Wansuia hejianensis TaxID=2763667 RepID=A0A926IHI9_9FIRM|nr:folate family ECF transporter S component [Wansuia hejianensis]MBC8590727.1 folate family ECF transporter S component [Wansuia hejianensis]
MRKKGISTKVMVQAGFLVAVSIVLTRFLVIMPTNTLRIGLGEVPLMISGFLFGPIVGGIVGAAADLTGIVINPQGPPHFGFTLSSMLWGIIPGLFVALHSKRRKGDPYTKLNITVTVSICIIIISLGLNTYWLSNLYGKGFLVMLPERLMSAIISIPLQSIIIISLMKYLKNVATVFGE